MKKTNNKNITAAYWQNRVSKLASGKSIRVPNYATVTAYRCQRTGARRFKITSTFGFPAGGNRKIKTVKSDIATAYAV